MADSTSEFYPPRGWNGRMRHWWFAFRRNVPARVCRLAEPLRLVAAFALPGVAFFLCGNPVAGKAVMAGYGTAVLLFLACLGQGAATAAAGVILALHTISAAYLLNRRLPGLSPRFRAVLTMLFFVGLLCLVYLPLSRFILREFAFPLKTSQGVVVINTFSEDRNFRQEDIVAYSFESTGGPGFEIRGGYGVDPVLAGPGDVIEFKKNNLFINGQARPALPVRVPDGTITLPENHWFIWPTSARLGGANPAVASGQLLQIATVKEDQILGRPFKRWFWRRQVHL